MTLSSLFIVCSHGRRSAHEVSVGGYSKHPHYSIDFEWCQGGRPATLGDLGGEKVWWCEEHSLPASDQRCMSVRLTEYVWKGNCLIVERILLPLPQMVAE